MLTSKTELSMTVCMAGLHRVKCCGNSNTPVGFCPPFMPPPPPPPIWDVLLTSKPKRSLKPCFPLKKIVFLRY